MAKGSVWNLVFGIGLLLIVVSRYALPLMAGHAPTPDAKNLALDAALVVFAVSRFLRYFRPDLAIIAPMRFAGLGLFLVYLGLKAAH